MAIIGIGTDIIEIKRIKQLHEKSSRFSLKVFSESELDYCLSKKEYAQHLAVRFAAKEAVAKALGKSFSWQDVEIGNDDLGKPVVVLKGEAKIAAKNFKVLLSMSHSRDYACAVAVVED